MDSVQLVLSPARRARRCILTLLVLLMLGAATYAGYRSGHLPFQFQFRLTGERLGASETEPPAASTSLNDRAPPTATSQATPPATETRANPHS